MKGLLKFLFTFIFLFFLLAKPVFAESITSFNSKLTAHSDGTFNITETIVYDFGSLSRHGIFRTIPYASKVGDLYRKSKIILQSISRDNQTENFADESSNSQFKVRIGDANKTITGEHTYILSYLVENGTTAYEDHDEIYWNITGNEWEVPIQKASVDIDTDFNAKPANYICFTGGFGSKEKNCIVNAASEVGHIETTTALQAGEGLTIAASFPPKTFPPSILTKENPDEAGSIDSATLWIIIILIVGGVLFLNIILPLILIIWYFKTKRKSRFGPITVNFDIPKDRTGRRIAPAEAGTIDTAMLDRDDVVGTIFDLAIRKFIKMQEIEKKNFLSIGSSKTIKLIKLKEYKSKVADFEEILLDRLFKDGDEIEINDLKSDFYKTFNEIGDSVFKDHVENGFYTKNPKNQRTALVASGFVSLFFGGLVLAIVLFVLSKKLNGRTQLGDELDFKIDGLKLFLKSMDRNYTWQADQLYIVEQMIPYAIALGYIEKFMEQLKIIKPDYNPTWYSGKSGFYLFYPAMFSSMNSSFVSAAPSSSGFSGGGFSGGGGGGGGGGSW